MKRTLTVMTMVIALALSMMAPSVAGEHVDDTGYATTAAEYDLVAGQDELAGKVYVWDVSGDVYVQYVANHGWCILETHVEVAADEAGIPQTRKGNPIPGQFAQGETFDDCATLAGHYVFDKAVDTDEAVVVAAHAAVRKYVETETGTLTPELTWQRSSEDDVAVFPGYGGQWDPATQGFEIPLDPDQVVWDNGSYYDNNVPTGRGFASWEYASNDGGSYNGFSDLRRFQASFEVPDGYEVTAGRLQTPDFADGIPINDNVYIFANGPDNLLFWGGTRVNQIPDPFEGMTGTQALRGDTEPVETDEWYIPGSIPDVTNFVEGQNEIDIFTEENEKWGGMGELILELDYESDVFRYETAWADGNPFVERGNWATYATYKQGSGTLVDSSNRERELTFLVFDLGDNSQDLGGMAWVDGQQEYAVHTVCTEVAGNSAWFTYQIPEDAGLSAAGAWVTFKVTADGEVGYDYSRDKDAMVTLCEERDPDISGGWTGPSEGDLIVHPGS